MIEPSAFPWAITKKNSVNLFNCFVDYKKAFDNVSQNQLWISMIDIGFPLYIIDLM